MQSQIHDRSSLHGSGYSEGLKTILAAISETDALHTAQEAADAVKPCGCPPGICLGQVSEDLGLGLPVNPGILPGISPPSPDASAEEHAAFGARLAEMLAETLPRGPNGEAPTVVFDGVYRRGQRLDVPAGEPVTGEPMSEVDFLGGFEAPGANGDDMPDADDFEKRTVVAQLVRAIENIGAAAAIAGRLVEETFEV